MTTMTTNKETTTTKVIEGVIENKPERKKTNVPCNLVVRGGSSVNEKQSKRDFYSSIQRKCERNKYRDEKIEFLFRTKYVYLWNAKWEV